MPAAPRRRRNSSSDSSDGSSSSSDDDYIHVRSTASKANELTLKDDEDTINIQAPLPEEYGKNDGFFLMKIERLTLSFKENLMMNEKLYQELLNHLHQE